ncbi:BACON domain-containing protein [Yinghuangia seranimata]|uniref:BACON domain-containing protein n=1 Tax=Yinghuangia seranimata TaxID=408067 RepID=UPI00248C7082|nr:hypothetical protein [Yinghuangia seranimata]MDI2132620.1 hypothetical protein [Yinghuangia seranimata]
MTTGAPSASTRAAHYAARSWGRAAYDAYAEGLYTYCLSVLRDHAAAASSLRSTFVLADRHIGRLPDLGLLKPWLYALARYECLVRLDGGLPPSEPAPAPEADDDTGVIPLQARREARERAELATLAWPEAIGLEPEQREALELSVRHGLEPRGLAAVLGWNEEAARHTLLHAGREVDRTRAALEGAAAALSCPDGPALAADASVPGVRDKLVAHVDDCRRCGPHVRLAAARLVPTTGAAATPESLPTIPPPNALRDQVLGDVGRGRAAHRPAELTRRVAEFDRAGFPVFRSRAGRGRGGRRRLTAFAAAVIAIVAAVPAIVLWEAAQRGDDAAPRDTTISAARVVTVPTAPGEADITQAGAGHAGAAQPTAGSAAQRPVPSAGTGAPAAQAGTRSGPQAAAMPGLVVLGPAAPQAVVPPPAEAPAPGPAGGSGTPVGGRPPVTPVPPAVDVTHDKNRTVVTLRNTNATAVDWTADTTANWLQLSRTSGTLAPGASDTIVVTVDSTKAPTGAWSANVRIQPGSSQVTIEGNTGATDPTTSPKPTTSPTASGPATTGGTGTTAPTAPAKP